MSHFENKVAVITGSARGLGRSIAERLASEKCNIVISDLDHKVALQTANQIASKYEVKTLAIVANVTNKEQVQNLAQSALTELGSLDIWVNNAGIIKDDLMLRMKESDWDLVIDVNLKGVFLGTQAATKVMMKAKKGRVINISSVAGLIGSAGQANYAAAKAGAISVTRTAAREFASRNITVNAITPGYIKTDMTDVLPKEIKKNLEDAIPLKYKGSPEDIAAAVRFFASEDAKFITGVIMRVDGGMAIGM